MWGAWEKISYIGVILGAGIVLSNVAFSFDFGDDGWVMEKSELADSPASELPDPPTDWGEI